MIKTKNDLKDCLQCDATNYKRYATKIGRLRCSLFSNPIDDQKYIWKYIRTLRFVEYYCSNKGIFNKLMKIYHLQRLKKLAYITGFQIPPFTIGKGLTIWHWGHIIINGKTRIGENCTLYPGVEIGHKTEGGGCPNIGNNVFIAAGVKIFGDVTIGNNVIIAANSVIVKDIPDNVVVAGAPATIIKENK